MNCINNFSICVKIYCQIHILSLIFFFLLISYVRYRTSPQRRGLTYHPVFEAKNIFLPVLYIDLSSTGRCGTTILHQDTISQLIIETVNDILVDCRLGLKRDFQLASYYSTEGLSCRCLLEEKFKVTHLKFSIKSRTFV